MENKHFIIFFLLKAIAFYVGWLLFYDLWLAKIGWLDNFIIDNLVYHTEKLLSSINYSLFVYDHTIGIDGSHGVYIGKPCNGIELMALFSGFVIVFKGGWKHKLWYVPLGILFIYLFNLLRVIALTLMEHLSPELLEFNHKYTFTIILYMIVFFGWIIWVKKFSLLQSDK